MSLSTATPTESIISPREICETCHNSTGPKFILSHLRGPTDIHRTNIIPTGAERESVEASIASAYAQAAQLEVEIVRLQTTLETLIERRDALRRFAKQEQGLFSPVRKLPADVLRQIFIIAHEERQYIFCDDLEAFPRIATQVSSFWRSVAHSCAPLWRDFQASRYQEKYGVTYGELIRKCITFSNQLPLSAALLEGCTPSVLGSECVLALGQCASRWESMTIEDAELSKSIFGCIPSDAWFYELTDLDFQLSAPVVINPCPKLTHLSVTGFHDPTYTARMYEAEAESLVNVTLKDISHPLSTFEGMPWIQITQFEGTHIYYQRGELLDLLGKMKYLVSLSLTEATEPESTGSLTLRHLTSLSLSDTNMEPNILEHLTTPNLKNLSLKGEYYPATVAEFAQRSHFSLEFLKISTMEIDDSWASPEFDSVNYFYWENPWMVASGIEWLRNDDVPSPAEIFPRLERLHISKLSTLREEDEDDEDDEWTATDMIHMLKSRIPTREKEDPAVTGRYLKHVFISFVGLLSQEDIASFEGFLYSDVVRISGARMMITDGGGTSIRSF